MSRATVSKKICISAVLAMMLLLGAVAGCSSSDQTSSKKPTVDEIVNRIRQSADIKGMRLADGQKLEKLYGIKTERLDGFALYLAPSNIKAEEIAVLKVKDPQDLPDIKKKVEARVAGQAAVFKDYLPEEYYLIEKHVLKTHGSYVLLVISRDAARIAGAFDKAFN